jgi:dipeptide/tripeptide permease
VFYGLHDILPIFGSILTDGYLGGYLSIVIFGFIFVFGLSVSALVASPGSTAPTGLAWCSLLAMCLVAISAGTLSSSLTVFGGSQFHPIHQASSGGRFFSWIFNFSHFGAILGISIAFIVLSLYNFKTVLMATAIMAGIGYISFISGSWTYVKRCAHGVSNLGLVWDCLWARSFEKNKVSNGGKYSDKLVDDLAMMLRLVPIFGALIPLYIGQLQVLTTFRTIGYRLWMPINVLNGKSLPQEILLFVEPATAFLLSFVLDGCIWPLYHRFGRSVPTHLTRLTIGGISIAIGFFASFGFYRYFQQLSEIDVKSTLSIYYLFPMLVLFAIGQTLIMSSGYQMSYTIVPERMKGFSVSLFLLTYALGSLLAMGEFAGFKLLIDEPGRLVADGLRLSSPTESRFDLYFLMNGCLSIASVLCLVLLRNYYSKSRQMKIEADLRQRMIDIAVRRVVPQV